MVVVALAFFCSFYSTHITVREEREEKALKAVRVPLLSPGCQPGPRHLGCLICLPAPSLWSVTCYLKVVGGGISRVKSEMLMAWSEPCAHQKR